MGYFNMVHRYLILTISGGMEKIPLAMNGVLWRAFLSATERIRYLSIVYLLQLEFLVFESEGTSDLHVDSLRPRTTHKSDVAEFPSKISIYVNKQQKMWSATVNM